MASEEERLPKRPLYVFDLPRELLTTLQHTTTSNTNGENHDQTPSPDHLQPTPKSNDEETVSGSTACVLCGLSFENVEGQRQHVRSDFHRYNLRQKIKGMRTTTEADFETMIGDLDESISGSASSDSDTDGDESGRPGGDLLTTLLKKQAKLGVAKEEVDFGTRKHTRGAGKPPLYWFRTSELPQNTNLGIYRAIFTQQEQEQEARLVEFIQKKQLSLPVESKELLDDGGIPLPRTRLTPHIFLCMVGGGHFAAMIVSLAPKMGKKQGQDERQAAVLAHKTFHRYTTRRKQGGAQSSNDNAKGNAHSAGASIRRYNEAALESEIRELLTDWKGLVDSAQLLFIRASGTTNRRTLFGPYDRQVLKQNDPRNRGFPFSTRRATQAELMRCFVELTRAKVSTTDEAAIAVKAVADEAAALQAATARAKAVSTKASTPTTKPDHEAALLHTTQIEALIRRSKAPALLSYLTSNSLLPDFRFFPPDSQAHHHAPTPLHLAASSNSPALVSALLTKARADPTLTNGESRTAFEIAGDRATRDAFRVARAQLGEAAWAWDKGAKVPEPLTREEWDAKTAAERKEQEVAEAARREAGLKMVKAEEAKKEAGRQAVVDMHREKRAGKGRVLNSGPAKTAEETRAEEAKGMTPETRMKLERERRARAAEERMKNAAKGIGAGK